MTPGDLGRLLADIDYDKDPQRAQEQWNAFLNELLAGARLHAIADPGPARLMMFVAPDRQAPFLPAFSDLTALQATFPNLADRYVEAGVNDFIAAVRAVPELPGVQLDPTTRSLLLSREVLEDMASFLERGHEQTVVQEETPIYVGDPAVYPDQLVADLAAEAARQPAVRRLWIRQMQMNGELSYMLLIDGDMQQRDTMLPALGRVVQMHPELTQPVDLVPYRESYAGQTRPFYERR